MIVFEILLIGGGVGLYFSGVGVIPASVLWGAPLLIEAGMISSLFCKREEKVYEPLKERRKEAENIFPEIKRYSGQENLSRVNSFLQELISNQILFFSQGETGLQISSSNAIPSGKNSRKDFKISDWLISKPVPNQESAEQFWKKILKKQNPLIVLLSPVESYWPEQEEESKFGTITTEATQENFRKFTISIGGKAPCSISQFYMEEDLFDAARTYEGTAACLEAIKTREAQIIIHEEGPVEVFVICLTLHILHEIIKGTGYAAEVDVQKLSLKLFRSTLSEEQLENVQAFLGHLKGF